MDLVQEKGASSWLTALPREEFGFVPHKDAFRDALTHIGTAGKPLILLQPVPASFTMEHALSCPKGGFPTIRHNKVGT